MSVRQISRHAVFRVKDDLAMATSSLRDDSVAVDTARFSGDILEVWREVSPTREGLTRLILRARRCNAWFKLKWSERRYLEAVVRVVDRLRSPLLLGVVGRIVEKLLRAMRDRGRDIAQIMRTVGKPVAQRLSRIAQRWGDQSAARWAEDERFIRFLTIMYINGATILP